MEPSLSADYAAQGDLQVSSGTGSGCGLEDGLVHAHCIRLAWKDVRRLFDANGRSRRDRRNLRGQEEPECVRPGGQDAPAEMEGPSHAQGACRTRPALPCRGCLEKETIYMAGQHTPCTTMTGPPWHADRGSCTDTEWSFRCLTTYPDTKPVVVWTIQYRLCNNPGDFETVCPLRAWQAPVPSWTGKARRG